MSLRLFLIAFLWGALQVASAVTVTPSVAASLSTPQRLNLFRTDATGVVQTTWWDTGCGWQPWFLIHPEVKMAPNAPVTQVWRSNNSHVDLFVTGTDGAIWSSWWEAGPGWQPWFLIHPEVKMRPGAVVNAIWRSNDTHLDLFVTGTDGAVWSSWWEAAAGWQSWFLIHPEVKVQPGATVTALWRSSETHLDLFAAGTDGAIWSTWWEGTPGWQPWFLIHPEVKMQPGASVSALWRSNDTHLDLFAAGTDGAVWSTWWEATPGWQPWFLIHPEVKMQPGASVSAVWRSDDTHLDLFAVGKDANVWSSWWEATPGWQSWFSIFPAAAMARVNDPGNVLTGMHDNARSGSYVTETTLTPANVTPATFGKLYQRKVLGQMLAQPLYLKAVPTRTQGSKNLIIAATAANMVYAFDADNMATGPEDGLVFSRLLHPSNPLDPSQHNSIVPVCTETYPPYIGVTSTPVIDAASNTLYLVSFNSADAHHYLHALDLTDNLNDKFPPAIIEPADSLITAQEKARNYSFGLYERNRPSLLLENGVIYIGFAGFICDNPTPYMGWVFGYTEDLRQISTWRTPPNVDGGGIWQGGRGLVGGPDGSIYFQTGNDNGNLALGTLGNSFVKLGTTCSGGFTQSAVFEPANSVTLSKGDVDLGSSGPILVNDRLIGGGKQGRLYVLDRANLNLTQDVSPPDGFQGFQAFMNTLHGPGQVKMQPGAPVTAVWRSNDTHLDLFVTGTDGAVWSTWWEAAAGWQTWFLVHPEVKFHPGGQVTALWRSNDTHLDLFVTGTDGAVWSSWWEAAAGWQPWFLVHPEVKFHPGGSVTAAWRSNDTHLDLFVTGTDGAVWSSWWESAPGWQPWFLIHPEIKMQPGVTVSALWRSNDTHLDLFATGTDGAVWSSWWEATPGWQPWFLIHPEVKMQPGATVSALWRSSETHLDLFATGTDGAVWSTWWEGTPGWQPWFLIHPEVKMQPGASVSALWRSNDTHLDLFATGTDGAVWSSFWESQPGWQPWFLIHPEIKMQPGASVSALWRSNDTHLDLFASGTDGAVWSSYWESQPGWQSWFLIHPNVQACTNITITATQTQPTPQKVVRVAPDGGDADRYCRDPNSIQPNLGYRWSDQPYDPGCYLPISCYQITQAYGPNIHAGLVYWPFNASTGFLYGMAEKDYLRQFRFDVPGQQVEESPVHVSTYRVPEGMPGGAIALSANGGSNGIVWLSMPSTEDATGGIHQGTLLAADAMDLHPLWSDACVRYFAKFNPAIITSGKVVLATFADPSGHAVPGLECGAPPAAVDTVTNPDGSVTVNINDFVSGKMNAGTAWIIVYGLKPQ